MSNEEPNEKPSHSEGWKILVIFILVGPLVRVRRKILGNHVRQLPHPADMNCKAFFRIELATALAPGVRVSNVLLADIAMLHHFLRPLLNSRVGLVASLFVLLPVAYLRMTFLECHLLGCSDLRLSIHSSIILRTCAERLRC